jgi:hypothetical protein
MRRYDIHGRKIDYDAPGQLGRHSKPAEKLPRIPRFQEQLDRLTNYYDAKGKRGMPLRVTLEQIRRIMRIHPDDWSTWRPSGEETYRGHPLVVIADEDAP